MYESIKKYIKFSFDIHPYKLQERNVKPWHLKDRKQIATEINLTYIIFLSFNILIQT